MKEAIVHIHPPGLVLALVGNPNCGKSALFNLLTGSQQKVGNYAGVTVERKEGRLMTDAGKPLRIIDLPGVYSLYPRSIDERVTVDVLTGKAQGEKRPDGVICVVDATNLQRSLRLVLAIKRLGLPCVVALNMADLAAKRHIHIDVAALSAELGVPLIGTVGVQAGGDAALRQCLNGFAASVHQNPANKVRPDVAVPANDIRGELDHVVVRQMLKRLKLDQVKAHEWSDRIDSVVLDSIWGSLLLLVVLFLIFQAVFAWAAVPMDWIKNQTAALAGLIDPLLADGWLKSLLLDGVIAGAGGVLVFLPQILILFFFILLLEESGYLPRAAFLLDRLMGGLGLSGRSFIPLLSSFACAIPGIMATRTIANERDRKVTMLIAPLMTCSARLPVYALLIGAFIPRQKIWGDWLELQGLVLLGLYAMGIVGAMAVAWTLKKLTTSGQVRPLMMELPNYHWPTLRYLAWGLWQRCVIFLKRVGGVVMVLTLALWLLSSYPKAPEGATAPDIEYSMAGHIGKALAVVFEPIGFNWQISTALVPGMAAREVAVSALGTVYALSGTQNDDGSALGNVIAKQWSLPTALSLMMWYVFAPQCLSTLAAMRRETGSWRLPAIAMAYLFAMAYAASWVTYRLALWLWP